MASHIVPSLPHPHSPPFQFDSLDGLRGIAVLIVFFAHTANVGVPMVPSVDFSGIGKSGVFLFFLLSAFLLTSALIKVGRRVFELKQLLHYFNRRFFRIYPLYFLYLLLALLTTAIVWKVVHAKAPMGIPFQLTGEEFIQQLLLQQGKGVTWSIVVEFHYYFLLPVVAAVYSVLLRNRVMPCTIVTVAAILASQYWWPAPDYRVNDPRLGFYLPVFFIGSLLAVIHMRWQGLEVRNDQRIRTLIDVLGCAALLAVCVMTPSVLSWISGKTLPIDYFHKSFVTFALLWSLVLFACIHGNKVLRSLFEAPVLRFFGFVSYSVYLIHMIVIDVTLRLVPNAPLLGWIMLAVTAGLSWMSWTWIEKPASALRIQVDRARR